MKANQESSDANNARVYQDAATIMDRFWEGKKTFDWDDLEKSSSLFGVHANATKTVMKNREAHAETALKEAETFQLIVEKQSEAMVKAAEAFNKTYGQLLDTHEKALKALHEDAVRKIEREDLQHKKQLENIRKKRLDAAELTQMENEEDERHKEKVMEIESSEREKKIQCRYEKS